MKKVFISYSWDSPEHQHSIFKLSNQLRADGIDCDIDQYHQSPEKGWPRWMKRVSRESDYVLVVCTANYLSGFNGTRPAKVGRGVKWESLLNPNDIGLNDSNNNKYIPIIFDSSDHEFIHSPLKDQTHFDLSSAEGYEDLYRLITGQPNRIKPPLGDLKILGSDDEILLAEMKNAWAIELAEDDNELHKNDSESLTKKPETKKSRMLWVIAFFASAIVVIPNLSTTLKTFGLPYDWPTIKEFFSSNSEPVTPAPIPTSSSTASPDQPEKIPVRITPVIENKDFSSNTVSLNLSVEALERNCSASIESTIGKDVFLIACTGEIGDKISFVLSSKGCTDEKVDAKLAYDKVAYIQCP